MNRRSTTTLCILFLFLGIRLSFAQEGEQPLKIFGYFQGNFTYQLDQVSDVASTSFSAQQLNLFLQKDINTNWAALVDFEVLNSFSSYRRWGAFNLEEAWVRYRNGRGFNLKLGLQIPTFNNLNEIKNKTPILPYVIRPLAYETSFNEFIAVEEYVPSRAYVQAYGIVPAKALKLEYAAYVGNSPNIRSQPAIGQSGVDTTTAFLVGGRVGILAGDLKAGVSATHERVNALRGIDVLLIGSNEKLEEVPRIRVGLDASFIAGHMYFATEFIYVVYKENVENLDVNKGFFYGTGGYFLKENLLAYLSYFYVRENYTLGDEIDLDIVAPTVGVAYNLNDRITFKGQYAFGMITQNGPGDLRLKQELHYLTTAVSVVF